MKRDNYTALIFVLTALIVMGLSWFTRSTFPISGTWGKYSGEAIFIVGMLLFVWGVVYLRETLLGTVALVTDQLITAGPYHWVRHPLYLSMILILIGISLALRSMWGIIGVLALFTPTVVYRARCEEEALANKFRGEWEAYVSQTSFLIPWLW